ncbi:SDR family NAD(P)-dependent oxidoreductase [Aspergillus puulaauensis]|uniref:NAD(P)-binding protein n=1 Tax=Aspergillus puulaauensis TaxID=1220207 RepID=A0A7R7XHZ5_9EURO|nr:uncharacterized protein APUU_30102S [Aspergillus puulaauensis]BCS21877.1 hypothetical protein APUU_30102S [Aspergillus puulaauensis]
MSTPGLRDRTIIITGVSRGLGASIAQAVLEAGGDVYGIDILPQPVEEDRQDISTLPKGNESQLTFFQADIRDEPAIESALAQVRELAKQRGKPVLGLVNCAGVQHTENAEDFPVHEFQRIIDVNVMGSFIVAKHTARLMIAENWKGSMVLIGSIAGYVANRGIHGSAYCASKAAVQMMVKSFAYEWGKHGIRVNSLSPGPIMTNMVGELLDNNADLKSLLMSGAVLGRLGVVQDVQGVTVFLLSDTSGYMTGADVKLDGGATISV